MCTRFYKWKAKKFDMSSNLVLTVMFFCECAGISCLWEQVPPGHHHHQAFSSSVTLWLSEGKHPGPSATQLRSELHQRLGRRIEFELEFVLHDLWNSIMHLLALLKFFYLLSTHNIYTFCEGNRQKCLCKHCLK